MNLAHRGSLSLHVCVRVGVGLKKRRRGIARRRSQQSEFLCLHLKLGYCPNPLCLWAQQGLFTLWTAMMHFFLRQRSQNRDLIKTHMLLGPSISTTCSFFNKTRSRNSASSNGKPTAQRDTPVKPRISFAWPACGAESMSSNRGVW